MLPLLLVQLERKGIFLQVLICWSCVIYKECLQALYHKQTKAKKCTQGKGVKEMDTRGYLEYRLEQTEKSKVRL